MVGERGGWCSCGNILSGIITLWLNEDHLFNTWRPATINQSKDDYLNRGRWVLKWLRLPEAEVYCLIQGHREVLDLMGYQIPWKSEWSNDVRLALPRILTCKICFVMNFLLGNLSFWNISWSPENTLPERKGAAYPQHPWRMWRMHLPPMCGQVTAEKLLDHLFSNCPNAGSGRLLCVPRNFSFPACKYQLCTPRQ